MAGTGNPHVRPAHAPWLAAGAALVAIAVLHLAAQVGGPSDGARVTPGSGGVEAFGLRVAPIDAASALVPGDLVLAVDGRPLPEIAAALLRGAPPGAPPVGGVVTYTVERAGTAQTVDVRLGAYPWRAAVRANGGTVAFALVTFVVASFLYARRPNVPATRPLFLCACALVAATTWSFGLTVNDFLSGGGFWLYHAGALAGFMLFWLAGLHFAVTFPAPLPLVRPGVLALLYGAPFAAVAASLALGHGRAETPLAWVASWGRAADVHAAAVLTLVLVAFTVQYRSQRTLAGRQQIRWVVFGALVAGGAGLLLYLLPPLVGLPSLSSNAIGVVVSVFPVGIAIAVLRHGLFDIDRLLGHALVYGALSGAVAAVYLIVVVALGGALGAPATLGPPLLATVLAALAVQPVRERLQRAVDRRLVGERSEPARLVHRLGERLEATAEPDRVLPTLVETVAEALKLPYVAVLGEDGAVAAEYGRPQPVDVDLPLLADGHPVGRLVAAPRDRGGVLGQADAELLATVARQAGSAVRALRLARDLDASRRALVTLREEERRRLRRDLHDGLGPTIAAMALKVDAARNLIRPAPDEADALLEGVAASVRDAVHEVRRVVHDLRPPSLDELGLVGAVREQALLLGEHGLTVEVTAPPSLPGLSAAVEVAALRIVQEALTNVVRHAGARHCRVTLVVDGGLRVEVRDDGRGITPGARAGVGLRSMRERAAEVGGRLEVGPVGRGGTRVAARLPLEEVDA